MNRKVLSVCALVLVFALTLLAGCQKAPVINATSEPTATVEPTAEPTVEPTAEPTEEPAEETADAAQVIADIKNRFLTENEGNLPAFMELTDEDLKEFYGIDPEWLNAYTCNIPMMNVHATEFFVAEVKEGYMENVMSAIDARQTALDATWSMYLPAQYELVQNSIVLLNDNYMLYAVTEHADSIQTIFNETIEGTKELTLISSIAKEFLTANEGNLPAFMELTDADLKDFYGIDPEWLNDYSCNIPMMMVHATEFFVAEVKDGQMDNVKAAIDARKASLDATWSMYLPAQYELVQKSITVENGNFILFAVTEHTDSITAIFNEATK